MRLTQRAAVSGSVHCSTMRGPHGAADQRPLVRDLHVPVRQIAVGGNLERAEDRHVDVSAPDHRKRPRGIDDRGAGAKRDRPASRVDEVRIGAVARCERTYAHHAVLGMEEHVDALRNVIGDRHRQADAEIDEPAVTDVLGGAPDHLAAIELHGLISGATMTRSM
jgi:hypothetical protein